MSCGQRIKKRRKELGLNQTELANKVGLKFGTISKYEKDEISIPASNLKDIANILNVSVDYLLGNTSLTNPKNYLEETLSKYDLTETEYDMIFQDFIDNQTINLSVLNSTDKNMNKIKLVYRKVLDIYLNYLEENALENKDYNLEFIEEHNKPIDTKFIEMLKSIDKNKIIHQQSSNAFPTIDIPKKYPILGKISAGLPILATENIEGYSFAPSSKVQEGYDYFYLKVKGDSMNLKFPNGCLLFIQKQSDLENGQIGVFRINGDDATVKRFKKENGLVILEPMSTNPIHQVQIYNPKDIPVEIIGKVVYFVGDVN